MCAQEGNRNNPYTFDDYLFVRDHFDFYGDDEFFQALVRHYVGNEFEKIDKDVQIEKGRSVQDGNQDQFDMLLCFLLMSPPR